MTKVLLLSPTATPGGSERALAGLAAALPQFGYEPQAVLLEHGPLEGWLTDAGCPVVTMPTRRTRELHRTAATVARLTRFTRKSGANLVLSSQSKAHVLGGTAAALSRTPGVWWQHVIPGRSSIELLAARVPAAAVVCGSQAAATAQARITRRARVQKVHPGTDIAAVAAHRGQGRAVRQKLGWQGHPLVGIVGRLQPWKGQETFLRAAALLAREHPGARFLVIGGAILGCEGTYPEDLERLSSELGIRERVHFSGHREDVWDWCDALDIVVHASTGEPFGLVVVEAMALRKPVVAAADAGPLDIVEDGVSGLLTPPRDAVGLAEAVARLLRNPDFAETLAARAELRARDFSIDRMGREFAAVFDGILGESRGRPA
jgi:glycosyltransferase involved in cell wall biosynthesis